MSDFAQMADIARLADTTGLAAMEQYFAERKEEDSNRLGRRMVASPDTHGETEARHLKSFYAGVDAVLAFPVKVRAQLNKGE